MKNTEYTPLLYHSNYGVGGSSFKTLFEHLSRYHIKSCGIVDNTFFGLPEFIKHARTHGIKPIIGARISLMLPSAPSIKSGGPVTTKNNCHYLYLFVKDKQGYENLCGILTAYAFGNISIDLIKEKSTGLMNRAK